MKYILVILMFLTTNLYAANVAEFDENNNKVKDYKKSVDTNEYQGRNDVVINPDMPENVPNKYLKHSDGHIVEMNQSEKAAVDAEYTEAEENLEIQRINDLNVSVADLAKAIAALTLMTEQQIKDKIKEQKGLN